MPQSAKKANGSIQRQKPLPEQLKVKFLKLTGDVVTIAQQAKRQFDQLDQKTKRKVIAGVSGLAALLALRAHRRRRKR